MYGEGNWKADEEYREGLKQFSKSHDSAALARQAKEEIEQEPGSEKKGTDDEGEW
jgi:hypothetical protein